VEALDKMRGVGLWIAELTMPEEEWAEIIAR